MIFYNLIDELGRFNGYKVEVPGNGQYDTHGMSYMRARQVYQEMGEVMGLDLLIGQES